MAAGAVLALFWLCGKLCNKPKAQKLQTQDITITEGREGPTKSGAAMNAFVMLMFMAHPNIVQTMLEAFRCLDVDGDLRLQADLEVLCWH